MTAEKLGRTLKAFGVKSERPRHEGPRGYTQEALAPVFSRYLTPSFPSPLRRPGQPGPTPANQIPELIELGPALKNKLGPGPG
jgi:hypothetical protein